MPSLYNVALTADSGITVDTSLSDAAGESRVSRELSRVTTPYREAERFLAYVTAVLSQIDTAAKAIEQIPSFFDINDAVGDQLTLLGKRLGFPRCHCVCDAQPIVGFACTNHVPGPPIVGFCQDGVWKGCGGVSDLCLYDDEVYRAHLVARRYQMLGLYDVDSLTAAVQAIWGPTAWVPLAARGQVVVAPGRDLTSDEAQRFSVTLRALPLAPTMEIAARYGSAPIAGFGAGWGGFCADTAPAATWLCPDVVDPYGCGDAPPRPIVGFEGLDDGPVMAGFGDPEATWANCP